MKNVLPTPKELINAMDAKVHGQLDAKKILARAVYNHYLSLAVTESNSTGITLPRQHVLLVGPSGSGKTLLVKTITEFLDVKCLFVNTASLTVDGYIGEGINDVLSRLYSQYTSLERERAIIFLDEFDKLAGNDTSNSIKGTSIQRELLPIFDGNKITAEARRGNGQGGFNLDTSKILFIMTGAFEGLKDIVQKREGKNILGFGTSSEKSDNKNWQSLLNNTDLISYGIIPELIGRIQHISTLDDLLESDLISILTNSPGSPIKAQQYLYNLHGISIEYPELTIKLIAQLALKSKVGARGLTQIVNKGSSSTEFQLSELREKGVRNIIIHPGVLSGEEPYFDYSTDNELLDRSAEIRGNVFNKVSAIKSAIDKAITIKPIDSENIDDKLIKIKNALNWNDLTGSPRKWFESFENENLNRKDLVLKLLQEIQSRNSSFKEYFLAYVYSNTDNVYANLMYLDFRIEKHQVSSLNSEMELLSVDWTMHRNSVLYTRGEVLDQYIWRALENQNILENKTIFEIIDRLRCSNSILNTHDIAQCIYASGETNLNLIEKWYQFAKAHYQVFSKNSKTESPSAVKKLEDLNIRKAKLFNLLKKHFVIILEKDFGHTLLASEKVALSELSTCKTSKESLYDMIIEFQELTRDTVFVWNKISVNILLDFIQPIFKLLIKTGNGITHDEIKQISRATAHLVEEKVIWENIINFLPHPATLSPIEVATLVHCIHGFIDRFGNVGSKLEAKWGPGPWGE